MGRIIIIILFSIIFSSANAGIIYMNLPYLAQVSFVYAFVPIDFSLKTRSESPMEFMVKKIYTSTEKNPYIAIEFLKIIKQLNLLNLNIKWLN